MATAKKPKPQKDCGTCGGVGRITPEPLLGAKDARHKKTRTHCAECKGARTVDA